MITTPRKPSLLTRVAGRSASSGLAKGNSHFETLEGRQLLSASWDGGGGDSLWSNPLNWAGDTLPTAADVVSIGAGFGTVRYTNTVPAANRSVAGLDTSSNIRFESSGVLTVSGSGVLRSGATMTMSGGEVRGGAWDVTGGTLAASSLGGIMRDMTVTGDINISANSSYVELYGSTRFGTANITGSGAGVYVAPGYTLSDKLYYGGAGNQFLSPEAAGTFTIAATGEIRLLAGAAAGISVANGAMTTLTNNGLIANETTNRQLTIQPANFVNNNIARTLGGELRIFGTVSSTNNGDIVADDPTNVTSPTLSFSGAWSSTGRIISDAATINFGGTFTTAGMDLPGFVRTGGTVNITGTLDNTGDTLALNASTGTWLLRNGEIRGGTLSFADGKTLSATTAGGILRDLNINGDVTIDTTSAYFQLYGSTRFGTLFLTSSNSALYLAPGYVIRDKIYAGGVGNQSIGLESAGSISIASTGEVRLLAGAAGGFTLANGLATTLTNDGLIANETTNRQFSIQSVNFINNNIARTLGGDLRFSSSASTTNNGDIVADDPLNVTSPTLTFTSAWSNTGRIIADAATVNFGGTFTTAGMGLPGFIRSGGTVNITGTLNNTGDTLTLNASTGTWLLRNGEIRGWHALFRGWQNTRRHFERRRPP